MNLDTTDVMWFWHNLEDWNFDHLSLLLFFIIIKDTKALEKR